MKTKKIINKVLGKLNKQSLSNPKQYEAPERFDETDVLKAIRQDIIAEYDAINLYEAHLQATNDSELKEILEHIIEEEKEHAAELQAYLNKKDSVQKILLEKEMGIEE